MIEGMQIKICGLTSLADAEFAAPSGAGFLGFVLHPKSPRHVSLARFREMAARLPKVPRVAVTVEPAAGSLSSMKDAGFDFFQVHFRHDIPAGGVAAWSDEVGAENLWLAPKLPPGVDLPGSLSGLSRTVLLDTFDPKLFGGTGRTGDWPKFRRHREAHPEKTWILSGGLNPENITDAIAGTGARFVDVNSGVESAPGVKDHARLSAFMTAVNGASGQ
jgi:phosphoribosylanthranilate isomerase